MSWNDLNLTNKICLDNFKNWSSRLDRNNTRVSRRDSDEKRLFLLATIHPNIKRARVGMSKGTGMKVSQVTDEVLYAGLIGMQEMDLP